jgi:hypothetical protein
MRRQTTDVGSDVQLCRLTIRSTNEAVSSQALTILAGALSTSAPK